MELKDTLLLRRSVRRFTDEPVSDSMVSELLHAAMSGPSACNRQPWLFCAVRNPALLEKLRGATRFTRMNAPMAMVVCGDLNKALPGSASIFWVQDCSAATENILLRAVDLGLGTVWCGIHPQETAMRYVRETLGLDEHLLPLNIIWVGHPAQEVEPRDQYDEACVRMMD